MPRIRKGPKPSKPNPKYPLFAHNNGLWAKKVGGRILYFGVWADPQAALEKWNREKDDLLAGRVPRPETGVAGVSLDELVNTFLAHKESRVQTRELRRSTFNEYCRILKVFLDYFGRHRLATDITPQAFEELRAHLGKGICAAELAKRVILVRSTYKHAVEQNLLDKAPKFGMFKPPSVKVLRRARGERASRMLEPDELRKVLDGAGVALKAMVLLALNAGFGQSDVSALPMSALDLAGGFVSFPRPKTGVQRRCPLWAETTAAIKAAIEARPEPADAVDKDAVFLTRFGKRWVRYQTSAKKAGSRKEGGVWVDSVNLQFSKVLVKLKLKRPGASFYALRHVFRTIADRAGDPRACAIIMGHMDENDMASRYVEQVDDDRLCKVVDHVRAWLGIGKATKKTHKGGKPALKIAANG